MARSLARKLVLSSLVCAAVLWSAWPAEVRSSRLPAASVNRADIWSEDGAGPARPRWVRPANARLFEPPAGFQALPDSTHVMSGTFYDTRGQWESRLTLNNKGPQPSEPVVTLYSHNGAAYQIPDVVVAGDDFLDLDLNEITGALGGPFQLGSVEVAYYGKDLEMGAQLIIRDLDRGLQFDEQLSYASLVGNRREAVWWLPTAQAKLGLALTNMGDESVTVRTELHGAQTASEDGPAWQRREVTLGPHELRVLDLVTNGGVLGHFGGISVDYDGPAGVLMARGFVEDSQTGYSATVAFANPLANKSPFYHGGGVRLTSGGEALLPAIVARNTGSTSTTVNGRLIVSTHDGLVHPLALPSLSLGPGEAAVLDAQNAWAAAAGVSGASATGVEFDYASAPGTVVINAVSVSSDLERVYHVPLIDPETPPSSTGGYPWRVEDSATTVVYLKNTTIAPQTYFLQLSFPAGTWTPGRQTIEPGETIVLDIREVRDTQELDAFGRTIPMDATSGQVHWSIKGRAEHAIIGRAEHVDEIHGVSASYACISCCPDNPYSWWTDPDPLDLAPWSTAELGLLFQAEDCYETILDPYELSWSEVSWSIANTNVASGNGGDVSGVNAGTTSFSADFDTDFWEAEPIGEEWYCAADGYVADFDTNVDVEGCDGTTVDPRDEIIAEYEEWPVSFVPVCEDFSTDGSSDNFDWDELNQVPGNGHKPHGIVRSIVWTKLEAIRAANGNEPLVINSGYRCPHGNAHSTINGADDSRHQWGDAVDIDVDDFAEWEDLKDVAEGVGVNWTEDWNPEKPHLHVDWR